MGPIVRYLGPLVPKEVLLWQDPVPAVDHELIGEADIETLKAKILAVRPDDGSACLYRMGFGVHLPRLGQAWWSERRTHPPGAPEELGSEPATRAVKGSHARLRAFRTDFNARGQAGFAR